MLKESDEKKRLQEVLQSRENMERVFKIVKEMPSPLIWIDELDQAYEQLKKSKEKEKEVN